MKHPTGHRQTHPHVECGYQPVVDGVRHLAWHHTEPDLGVVVTCLCGRLYQVAQRPTAAPSEDCSVCDAAYRDRFPRTSGGTVDVWRCVGQQRHVIREQRHGGTLVHTACGQLIHPSPLDARLPRAPHCVPCSVLHPATVPV